MPFLSDQKIGGHIGPLPCSVFFLPKSLYQNFEIAILFNIVEKHNNYVFEADLLPHSPQGKGCNLQTLNFVIKESILKNWDKIKALV